MGRFREVDAFVKFVYCLCVCVCAIIGGVNLFVTLGLFY